MELLKKREMWLNSQTISLLPTSSEVFLCVSGSSFWSQQNSIPKLLYTEVEITFYKSVPWWGKMNLLSEGELKISKTFSRAIHYLYCFLWKSLLLSIFHRKCFISSLITGAKKCTCTDRTRRPWPLTTVNNAQQTRVTLQDWGEQKAAVLSGLMPSFCRTCHTVMAKTRAWNPTDLGVHLSTASEKLTGLTLLSFLQVTTQAP